MNVCGVDVTTMEQRAMRRELNNPMRAKSTVAKCEHLANLVADHFGDIPIGRLLQLASEVIYRQRLANGGVYAR